MYNYVFNYVFLKTTFLSECKMTSVSVNLNWKHFFMIFFIWFDFTLIYIDETFGNVFFFFLYNWDINLFMKWHMVLSADTTEDINTVSLVQRTPLFPLYKFHRQYNHAISVWPFPSLYVNKTRLLTKWSFIAR